MRTAMHILLGLAIGTGVVLGLFALDAFTLQLLISAAKQF